MAGRIPREFIDELLNRVDIVEVIDARVPLKKAGKDFKACCPFHDEKTPSFTVSQTKQFYHCFGCGKNGSAIGFLMDYENLSFPEAVTDLAQRAGLTVPTEASGTAAPDSGSHALLDLLNEAGRFYRNQLRSHPSAGKAIDYLKGRGLSGEITQSFGIGYAPEGWDNLTKVLGKDDPTRDQLVAAGLAAKKEGGGYYDRFRNRVIFPIHDHRGRIVGFGGRVMDPKDEPKYLNSPETALFHKGRELYGLFRARDAIKKSGRVLVVEGLHGRGGARSARHRLRRGHARHRRHARSSRSPLPSCAGSGVLFRWRPRRARGRLAGAGNDLAAVARRPAGEFPVPARGRGPRHAGAQGGRETFEARLKTARSLPDYLFESLMQKVDLGRLDGRARLVELARPLSDQAGPGALRELMLDRLAELSQVERGKLSTLLRSEGKAVARTWRRRLPAGNRPRCSGRPRPCWSRTRGWPWRPLMPPNWFLLDEPGADLFRELLAWFRVNPDGPRRRYWSNTGIIPGKRPSAGSPPGATPDWPAMWRRSSPAPWKGCTNRRSRSRIDRLLSQPVRNEQEQLELAQLLKLLAADKTPLSRD